MAFPIGCMYASAVYSSIPSTSSEQLFPSGCQRMRHNPLLLEERSLKHQSCLSLRFPEYFASASNIGKREITKPREGCTPSSVPSKIKSKGADYTDFLKHTCPRVKYVRTACSSFTVKGRILGSWSISTASAVTSCFNPSAVMKVSSHDVYPCR